MGISPENLSGRLDEFARLQRIENRSKTTKKIFRNKGTVTGIIILLLLFIAVVFGPIVIPYGYDEMSKSTMAAPSLTHPFGTDIFGRDTLVRTLHAARTSLIIAICATALSSMAGVTLGMISGYYGKATDRIIMGMSDVFMAIPVLLFAVCIIAVFGRGTVTSIAAIAVASMSSSLRISRGQTITLRKRDFVTALKSMGIPDRRIITRHILPNVLAPCIVMATIGIGFAVMVESALAYVGMGVPIPGCSLGSLVMEGRSFLATNWWLSTLPGLFIVAIVIGFNLFGDGLRDISDYHDVD